MFNVGDRVRWTAKEIEFRRAHAGDIVVPDEVLGTVTLVCENLIAVKPDDQALQNPAGAGDWWQESDEIELVEEAKHNEQA